MLALRVIVYASASVCCNIELHISRVCRFHVCFAFGLFCLFVCICMIVLRVLAYAFAFVCCKLAFHYTRVLRSCLLFLCV